MKTTATKENPLQQRCLLGIEVAYLSMTLLNVVISRWSKINDCLRRKFHIQHDIFEI